MDNQIKFTGKLLEVFRVLAGCHNLKFYNNENIRINVNSNPLLEINSKGLHIPISIDDIFIYKSTLEDTFVQMEQLNNLISELSETTSIIGLNHIGFCYMVDSQVKERERLKNELENTVWHLYEMESNDEGLWLFVGNKDNWQDPLVELLPVEKTNDKWVNYWLPHFQIDIDTKLSAPVLEELINKFFAGKVTPFRSCVIDGVVYSVRARLGVVSGINVNIDFATKERNIKYSREHLLKVII